MIMWWLFRPALGAKASQAKHHLFKVAVKTAYRLKGRKGNPVNDTPVVNGLAGNMDDTRTIL